MGPERIRTPDTPSPRIRYAPLNFGKTIRERFPAAKKDLTETALVNAALDAATSKPDLSPLDFLLEVMRDSSIPPDWRMKAALAALPYVHSKPERAPATDKQCLSVSRPRSRRNVESTASSRIGVVGTRMDHAQSALLVIVSARDAQHKPSFSFDPTGTA